MRIDGRFSEEYRKWSREVEMMNIERRASVRRIPKIQGVLLTVQLEILINSETKLHKNILKLPLY